MTALLILDLVVKSLATLLLAFSAQAFWRGSSASQRCLIWLAAFAGLLALPLTLLIEPYWAPALDAHFAPRPNTASQIVTLLQPTGILENPVVTKQEAQVWWQHLSPLQMAGLCWLADLLLVLGHRGLGTWQLRRLRARSSSCEDAKLVQQVAEVAESLGIRR